MGNGGCRRCARDERGQVVLLFALLLPMLLALGAVVLGLGNWFTHARNLQTKVDAAAFAGGAMWGFPCGADIDSRIEAEARLYFGSHIAADADPTSLSSPHNPQVGGIGGDRLYVSLNQADWWRGSFPASDFSNPAGSVCQSKILDVKATEQDVSPLFRLIPLFPDIKRKARVQIEEIEGLTGLLPIAVRLPQPLSAAAVFYDEASTAKEILAIKPFRQVCLDPDDTLDCVVGVPPGLGHWTTMPDPGDATGTWASVIVKPKTGVVVATSVRPACGVGTPPAGPPCLDVSTPIGTPIDTFCRGSGTAVRCFDADGSGATQTVHAGLQFIQGYRPGPAVEGGRPDLRRAWLENVDCPPAGYGGGYFNSAPSACRVKLTVEVDVGTLQENGPPNPPNDLVQTRVASNVQMRYCHVASGETGPEACDPDLGADAFGVDQDMQCSGGPGIVTCTTVTGTHPLIATDSRANAFAVSLQFRRTTIPGHPGCSNNQDDDSFHNLCRLFFTNAGFVSADTPPTGARVLAEPVQRTYMGGLERTTPIEWLRLTMDPDCDTASTPDDRVVGHKYPDLLDPSEADAASQPIGETRCYVVDLGTAGGLARDQDESPIAFNLGDNSSQRAYVDCDRNLANLKSEIVAGCQFPPYAANKFDPSDGDDRPYCPSQSGWFSPAPKPSPYGTWPPFRCVLVQPGNAGQVIDGFNDRIFNDTSKPDCPDEDLSNPRYIKGRNYWHRMNNAYDTETFAWDGDGNPTMKKGNTLRSDDPRLVMLFFTTYDSFTETGSDVYPIVGFGSFYVTGYGEVNSGQWKGGAPEDPCDGGSNSGIVGSGNVPPPDIDMSRNTRWVWGHFVNDVVPAPFSTGGSGALCNPEASFQPCVAVLVE